jgi:hypothetical protein
VEIGEQHMHWVLGAVPGGLEVTGPTAMCGCAKYCRTHTPLTTCESGLLVFFVHMFHMTLSTAMTC